MFESKFRAPGEGTRFPVPCHQRNGSTPFYDTGGDTPSDRVVIKWLLSHIKTRLRVANNVANQPFGFFASAELALLAIDNLKNIHLVGNSIDTLSI